MTNKESKLLEMLRGAKDPVKATDIAIKAILDFLASSRLPVASPPAAPAEPAETKK